ncbi:hypothetical protein Tco_0472501, partial [Tanacetum coccineum]
QHEDPRIQTSPLLTVPISVIPETSTAPATTIPPPIPPSIPLQQQSTPIPIPTTTEATTSTSFIPNSTTLTAIHQRVSDLEKQVKILKDINHDSAILTAIKSEVPSVVKKFLGIDLDDTLKRIKMEKEGKQQETKYIITSSDTAELQEFDQKRTLFETMTKTRFLDKGVADRLKKRKPDDADKDEGPAARPDQRKFAQAEETVFEAGDTQVLQNLGEDMDKTDEIPSVKADPKDWFKKPKRPPSLDPKWNTVKIVDDEPTQNWLSDLAK